jgi:LysM repeat protein
VVLLGACGGLLNSGSPSPAGPAVPGASPTEVASPGTTSPGTSTAVGSPSLTAAPSPTVAGVPYRVRSGDTLSTIARRFHRSIGQLLTANPGIADPDHIRAGQVISIPPADAPDLPPSIGTIDDAANDLIDETGFSTPGQAYADIIGFSARLRSTDLLVEVRLLGTPPRLDPAVEQLTFTVNIDINGDGQPDDTVVVSNNTLPGRPGYAGSLNNRATGVRLVAGAFPGSITVAALRVQVTLRLAVLGTSRRFGLAAQVERRFFPGGPGDSEAERSLDMAPDQQWPRPNAHWLTVGH